MFESSINSRKQGDTGMGYAIAYFTKLGWTVSIPITDSQDYDLVVDNGNRLFKVQVKTSKFKTEHGIYQVALRTCGGNKSGYSIKTFDNNSSDLLFVLLENGEMYLIPRECIRSATSINLGISMARYKVTL